MTYNELSQKIDQLLAQIEERKASLSSQPDYTEKIEVMKIRNAGLYEYANNMLRYINQSDFPQDVIDETSQLFHKIEDVYEETNIFVNKYTEFNKTENPQTVLSNLEKSLQSMKEDIQYCELTRQYADIIDKIVLIEEKYQDGSADERVATKNLARLKNLDILNNNDPDFSKLQNAIKSLLDAYEQEMQKFPLEASTYNQQGDIPQNIADEMEYTLNQIEQQINQVDTTALSNYSPELEEFIRQHSRFTSFISSTPSFKELKDEAPAMISNLSSQGQIANNEFIAKRDSNQNTQIALANMSNNTQELNQSLSKLFYQTMQEVLVNNDKQAKNIASLQGNIPNNILDQYGNCFTEQSTLAIYHCVDYIERTGIQPTNYEEFGQIVQMATSNLEQNKYMNLRNLQEQA
ncbi:MAG TPA: hypothetical protein IAC46_02560 [Candidatus Onthoplasma faecigallinarum]|nr:hypothetical protein [Candidatus Onthoplasma faecigallinarum]